MAFLQTSTESSHKYVYGISMKKSCFVIYFVHPEPLLSCCTFFSICRDVWIMNKSYVAFFEIIVVINQTLVFISHCSSLFLNQQGCRHVMFVTFVERASRGLSLTFLKMWHVNLITCLVSMQQQNPPSQTMPTRTLLTCCKARIVALVQA